MKINQERLSLRQEVITILHTIYIKQIKTILINNKTENSLIVNLWFVNLWFVNLYVNLHGFKPAVQHVMP